MFYTNGYLILKENNKNEQINTTVIEYHARSEDKSFLERESLTKIHLKDCSQE